LIEDLSREVDEGVNVDTTGLSYRRRVPRKKEERSTHVTTRR
jgi:hypothetical protein